MVDRAGSAHGAQLLVVGLHIAGVVDGAALHQRGFAVPHPVDVEAGQAFAEYGCFQPGGAPVVATVHRHIHPLHLAPARPGQARDAVETLVQQHLPAGGRGDHTFAFLDAAVLTVLAVRHQVDVVDGFVLGAVRLVAHLDAPQVLHPAHALHTGHHQAQRVAVLRAQHFAVLAVGHKDLAVFDQLHRHRAGHGRAVRTLGQHEARAFVVHATQLEQRAQRHTSEFAAAQHAVGVLASGYRYIAPFHAGVGATLDEVKARHRRQAHQLVHGEHTRLAQHGLVRAVDHQTVFGGVDVPPALVVALEVQAAGGDDAKQRLQRRKRHRGLGCLGQPRALATLHVGFKFGRLAVAVGHHGLAQALAVFGQIQDVGVATLGIYRVGGGLHQGRCCCRTGRQESLADERAPPLCGLGVYAAHPLGVQKILGRLAQAAHGLGIRIHVVSCCSGLCAGVCTGL